jgi:hypothetical protein
MNEPTTTQGSALADSSWGRLAGALVQPGATFRSIAARPSWVVALVVLTVIQIVAVVLLFDRVDMTEVIRQQMEARGQELPPGTDFEQMAGMQKGAGMGCAILGAPVGYVVLALLLMVAFKLVGGEIDFKRSFSVTLHAMMPLAVAGVLTIPVLLGLEEVSFEQMQTGSVLASNLGFLAPEDASPALVAVLSSLDVFSLWVAILLVLGFSIVARVSRGLATGVVVLLWLLWIGVKAALAALGPGMAG